VNLEALLDAAFDEDGPLATTLAVVAVHRGEVVAERYAGSISSWDGPDTAVEATTPLLSWSMAKSMLHAVVGMLVAEGRMVLDDPMDVPLWSASGDPRRAITLQQCLEMRDGLAFNEDYVDGEASDVIEMLFGAGKDDVAAFAAERPLAAAPGERFNYSSGTSNIVSGAVARAVGPGEAYEQFLRERLFEPLGMSSAVATFDAAGTFIASSYVHATARDFVKFGLLYLRDGVVDGRRLLPEGWVAHGTRERSIDEEGQRYGAHWWVEGDGSGAFSARGYDGQMIVVAPALDLVFVRLGRTPAERAEHLRAWRRDVLAVFRST
jgi:CubicO group peptidase (beta-lactamase class C family)